MNFSVTLMSDIFVPIYYNHRKNDLGTKKLKLSCIFSEHILQGSKNVGKLHSLEKFLGKYHKNSFIFKSFYENIRRTFIFLIVFLDFPCKIELTGGGCYDRKT